MFLNVRCITNTDHSHKHSLTMAISAFGIIFANMQNRTDRSSKTKFVKT